MSSNTTASIQVDARSLRSTVDALRKLEPDVLKELGKDLRRIVGQLKSAASAKYHTHGGTTPAKPGTYSSKVSLGKRTLKVSVKAPTKEEAIFEFAATAHSPQGASLISMLDAQYGSPGRILWATFDAQKAELWSSVAAAVDRAEREANRRLLGGG